MTETSPLPDQDTVAPLVFYRELHRKSTDTTEQLQSISTESHVPVPRFFTAQSLKKVHAEPLPARKYQPDWILGIVLLCLVLLAWANFFYHKRLRQIFLAPSSRRFLNQLIRDGNLFSERISLVLITIYLLTLSLVLFLAISRFAPAQLPFQEAPYLLFAACTGLLVIYWLVKILFIRLVGLTFRTASTTNEYLLNDLIFNIITGLLLLPVLIPAIYLKSMIFLYASFFILGILMLFRFFRGFLIGFSLRKFSYLFLIVYLCALEILPLIMLLKLFLLYLGTTNPVQ